MQKDYAAFCEYYFPHFLQLRDKATGEIIRTIHNAPFHNAAALKVKNTSNLKAVFKWPRGHAKSTHMDIFTPLWLMFQPKRLINFMVLVGKSEESAIRLLGDIQAELQYNKRIIADFGKQMSMGSWTEGEFNTKDGVYFLACGRGQSPRGLRKRESRPDYIVIDDLDDDELCRNERRVRELTDWVKEALFGALDVGRGRFIMVGNLISKTSVLANICKTKGVHVSTIYAVDNEGNPVWQEKWTKEEAREYAEFVKYKTSQANKKTRIDEQVNLYFEVLRTYFEDTFITNHLPGLDKFFSLQSFSNIAAIGVNLFNIPMDDMLTLIHAWIAELYELNPDMVWKLPQVAKPHALDDTDDEAIAIVENLMDVRIALYIELVQFLEKELLDTEREPNDYLAKKDMLLQTMQMIWMLTFNEIHKVPQGEEVKKPNVH